MPEQSRQGQAPDERRRRIVSWLWRLPVVAALAGLGVGAYEAYRVHFVKLRPDPTPEFTPGEPQPVATLASLADVWAAESFRYEGLPAIAMQLPAPIPGSLTVNGRHYAAFSRVCTHQNCTVTYNTDPDAVGLAFNYRPDAPALVCHCHLSVFLPNDAGRVASGPAREPLPRIRLEHRGDMLYAVGLETRQAEPTT